MPQTNRKIHRDLALWIIRLNCDDPVERSHAQIEFKLWQQQHPKYLEYLNDIHVFNDEIQHLPQQHAVDGTTLHKTLFELRQQQNQILKKIGKLSLAFIGMCYLGYLAYPYLPLNYYLADYRTALATPQQFILEDGSTITLDAKSAINLDFTAQQRQIQLIQGAIYIDVAKDSSRPLLINTADASFRAMGTKFIVQKDASSSSLNMFDSEVKVCPSNAASIACQIIKSGQSVQVVDQQHIQALAVDIAQLEKAWHAEQILAQKMPMSDLLQRLAAYHHGFIVFNHSELSKIKVTGVINRKQDLAASLALLNEQYPELEFVHLGRWLTYAKLKQPH